MSISAVDAVLKSTGTRGNARCILIALADNANDDGVCWPAIATIAKKANVCERTAQSTIRTLVAAGELAVEFNAGPAGTNVYRITCIGGDGGVQVLRGASSAGVQTVAPEPSSSSSFPYGQEEGGAVGGSDAPPPGLVGDSPESPTKARKPKTTKAKPKAPTCPHYGDRAAVIREACGLTGYVRPETRGQLGAFIKAHDGIDGPTFARMVDAALDRIAARARKSRADLAPPTIAQLREVVGDVAKQREAVERAVVVVQPMEVRRG